MRKLFCFLGMVLVVSLLVLETPMKMKADDPNTIIQIYTGRYNTFMLRKDGTLMHYHHGTTGVDQFMTDVKMVALGYDHGMALKNDGSLWGWGMNEHGEVGEGTDLETETPVKIMDQVAYISAGGYSTLAIKKDGSLWGWGANESGQLITMGEENILVPTKIMEKVKTVSAGANSSYIVKKDNTLWAMGATPYPSIQQQKGNAILLGTDIQDVFAKEGSDDVLFLKKDASLWTWKSQEDGSMTKAKLMDGVATAAYGEAPIGILKKDGTLWIMRDYDWDMAPEKIIEDVSCFAFGYRSGLAVKKDGTLWGWDTGIYDQLGIPDHNYHLQPKEISVGTDVSKVFAGENFASFLKKDHTLWTFTPDPTTGKGNFVKVMDHVKTMQYSLSSSIVLKEDQRLVLVESYLTPEMYQPVPGGELWNEPVPIMDHVVSFDREHNQIAVVKSDGSLWQVVLEGMYYDPDKKMRFTAKKIANHVTDAAVQLSEQDGDNGIYAVKKDGTLWYYHSSSIAFDSYEIKMDLSPIPTKIATDVARVMSEGYLHAYIKTDGSLWTWGFNNYGQIGTVEEGRIETPTKILDNVVAVQSAFNHAMALQKDGSLWVWGLNNTGHLGTGNIYDQPVPRKVMDHVASVDTDLFKTIVLKTDGTVWGFGYDKTGFYLGENEEVDFNVPFQIQLPDPIDESNQ